jgi:hypothetical protein
LNHTADDHSFARTSSHAQHVLLIEAMAHDYHPQIDSRLAFAMSNPSNWNNLVRQDMSANSLNPPLYPQYAEHIPVSMLSSQDPNFRRRVVPTQNLHGGGPNDVKLDEPGLPLRPETYRPGVYPPASNPDVWRSRETLNDIQRLKEDTQDELSQIQEIRKSLQNAQRQ